MRPLTAAAKTADCVQQEEPRRLMQLLYRAFAARRSLLLLQLASQVRLPAIGISHKLCVAAGIEII